MKKLFFVCMMLFLLANATQAQVSIGKAAPPQKGTILDLNAGASYQGGLLLPHVNITDLGKIPNDFTDSDVRGADEVQALSGLVVWNTNAVTGKGIYVWDGTDWKKLSGSDEPKVTAETTIEGSDGYLYAWTSQYVNVVNGDIPPVASYCPAGWEYADFESLQSAVTPAAWINVFSAPSGGFAGSGIAWTSDPYYIYANTSPLSWHRESSLTALAGGGYPSRPQLCRKPKNCSLSSGTIGAVSFEIFKDNTFQLTCTSTDADSYSWEAPAGLTILSGENTATVTIMAGTSGTYFGNDIICTVTNACGDNRLRSSNIMFVGLMDNAVPGNDGYVYALSVGEPRRQDSYLCPDGWTNTQGSQLSSAIDASAWYARYGSKTANGGSGIIHAQSDGTWVTYNWQPNNANPRNSLICRKAGN